MTVIYAGNIQLSINYMWLLYRKHINQVSNWSFTDNLRRSVFEGDGRGLVALILVLVSYIWSNYKADCDKNIIKRYTNVSNLIKIGPLLLAVNRSYSKNFSVMWGGGSVDFKTLYFLSKCDIHFPITFFLLVEDNNQGETLVF